MVIIGLLWDHIKGWARCLLSIFNDARWTTSCHYISSKIFIQVTFLYVITNPYAVVCSYLNQFNKAKKGWLYVRSYWNVEMSSKYGCVIVIIFGQILVRLHSIEDHESHCMLLLWINVVKMGYSGEPTRRLEYLQDACSYCYMWSQTT